MRNAYLLLQSEFEHYLVNWNTISRFKATFREVLWRSQRLPLNQRCLISPTNLQR